MRKRFTAVLLALVMMTSLMSMPAAAKVSDAEHSAIQSAVTKIIKDHAKKVYQADADDDAFTDFFVHGFFGNRKDMILNDKSAMTASMFNSYLMQEALINGMTGAIEASQNLQQNHLTIRGDISWHNYGYTYNFTAYRGNSKEQADRMLAVTSTTTLYGKGGYTGPRNENDELMELLAGGAWTSVTVKRVETKANTAVYTLDLHIWDDFDFTSDYSTLANKGYNTSKDQRLVNMGLLMTTIGLDEFYWEYRKSFKVEVPYHCDHQSAGYHWDYEYSTLTLTPDGTDGYTANPVKRHLYEYKTKDAEGVEKTVERTYYSLAETIFLRHDKPWMIEMDWKGARSFQISPYESSSTSYGTFFLYSIYYNWVYFTEVVKLPEGQTTASGSKTQTLGHYVGVDLQGAFKYSSKYNYTTTLENRIAADGSNMIYVSIYNQDLDELVYGPEAMDTHWIKYPSEEKRQVVEENSKELSGKDFFINYLGNKSSGVSANGPMDLRIWENGKDAPSTSAIDSVYRAPTCTEKGCVVNTCRDCGYTYNTKVEASLGHSYGEYAYDNNSTCTADGTRTRVCARCGLKDTVTAPETVLGHDYGDYAFDNNSTCTADGTRTRICARCGSKDTVAAPDTAFGHSYDAVVTAPTCTDGGYTTHTCSRCGNSYRDGNQDPLGHAYEKTVTAPTCTAGGFTTFTCSVCGDEYVGDYTDLAEHTPVIDPYVAPTCVSKGKMEGSHCGVCGYVIKKQALISTVDSHNMEETIVSMPTYDAPGQIAYVCKDCGKTDYMQIPPLEKPTLVNPFSDVRESDWFYEPVLWAVAEGVTGGKTATTFAPNEGCTRAQVVTFLWAANGKPEPKSMDNPFSDVANDAWYLKPVLWAVENGITTGVSATEFGPEKTCTRAQIATFLWAAEGKLPANGTSEFVDVADSDWYAAPIIWAKEHDITGGIGEGKFGPNNTCTRAQVVTFLKKVYG